jgi:transposase
VPSPKLVPLVLSDAERASLEALSRKRTASQSRAERARVVLACAEEGGMAPLTRVAARTGLSRESVRKWRVRFMERRLDGLGDAPRPGAARTITDAQVEVLVTRTLSEKGRGQDSHWSTRSMAAETGLSQSSVSRIWRAFGLKPHIVETWKLSTDPEFIGKVPSPKPFVWTKSADEILETLAAYCQRSSTQDTSAAHGPQGST